MKTDNKKKILSSHDEIDIISDLYLSFRSIVTDGIDYSLQYFAQYVDLCIYEVPSGTECWTWLIPKKWTLNYAKVENKGDVILSSEEHPLVVAPYSQAYSGVVSKDELIKHLRWSNTVPDAFVYEFRFAYNYQMNDWCMTMPADRLNRLEDGDYNVDIDVSLEDGTLKIGEARIEGDTEETIVLMSHLCHPGQANDGIAGIVSALRVFQEISKKNRRKYSYTLLMLPETIGTVAYLWKRPEIIKYLKYGIFIEMPGVNNALCLKKSHKNSSKIDKVAEYVFRQKYKNESYRYRIGEFREMYGNDEIIFADPDFDIPFVSIQHFDFPEYHTSRDSVENVSAARLDEVHEVTMSILDIMEKDYIPKKKIKGPIYLSRYNLYADAVDDYELHINNWNIMQHIGTGKSVYEIADQLSINFEDLYKYLEKIVDVGLLEKEVVT